MRRIAIAPKSTISTAITTKVYGRLRATRTSHISRESSIIKDYPLQAHTTLLVVSAFAAAARASVARFAGCARGATAPALTRTSTAALSCGRSTSSTVRGTVPAVAAVYVVRVPGRRRYVVIAPLQNRSAPDRNQCTNQSNTPSGSHGLSLAERRIGPRL